jgi:cobalt-zinc-cadmium efflux system protein
MSKVGRLRVVLLLDLLLVAALLIVGLAAHSFGAVAAGVDYLADAAAIGISLFAIRLAHRQGRPYPSSWPDPTHVAALVNAGWLLSLSIGVVIVATRRLISGAAEVRGLPVLIVSATAAVVMLIGAAILSGDLDRDDGGQDLNIRAVLLDTAADAAAAAGLAFSGAVIAISGSWYWLDPAVALMITLVIGYHAVVLIWWAVVSFRPPSPAGNATT